jgi:short-subunit dehydrogenase involved in D-alanine esterification of teichoic acids
VASGNTPDLNVLVNNAGISATSFHRSPAALTGPSELLPNLIAPIELIAMLVPSAGKREAAIINVTSVQTPSIGYNAAVYHH